MAVLPGWTAPGGARDAGSDGSGYDLPDERARLVMNGLAAGWSLTASKANSLSPSAVRYGKVSIPLYNVSGMYCFFIGHFPS
jgi:hypothetical protein